MNIQKSINVIIASAALTAVAVGASFAQGNLVTGSSITPTATTVNGNEVVFTTNTFAAPSNRYTGTLYAAIFQESSAANPLGGLTFVYQASNDPGSLEFLDRLTPVGFTGYQTSVFYSTQALSDGLGTGTVAPNTVIRLLPTGDSLAFRFETPGGTPGQGIVQNGQTTDVVVVRTDATTYMTSLSGVSDGTTANVASYSPGPSSTVPEPATLAPFALGGLGLLGLIVRKTRRTNGAAA